MNCPACDSPLEERTISDVRLDVGASGCGGVWFDQFEFRKFDEPHEEVGASLLELEGAQQGRDRAARFAHALRFITPSYYIPGDQEWGAY
ncbi:MAG TPA: zf-TFIIB domain-containing protein [Gemmatimonadota bacterium]|nr:zf-TFIIB domain-containing protein [Gemmatimonadota bacterium]